MIRKLRRRHFWMMMVLAVALPLVFALGLVYRKAMPAMSPFPSGLEPAPSSTPSFWQKDILIGEVGVTIATSTDGTHWAMDIRPGGELAYPDLLVYAGSDPQALDREYLIGTMAGAEPRRFQIPETLVGQGFGLQLYSLAHREVVAELAVPAEATASSEGDL